MDMPNGYGLWVYPFLPRSLFAPTSISVWPNYTCPVINSPGGRVPGRRPWPGCGYRRLHPSPVSLCQSTFRTCTDHSRRQPWRWTSRAAKQTMQAEERWQTENCDISCHHELTSGDVGILPCHRCVTQGLS